MANIKLFTVITMMVLAFVVGLASFTGQTTAAELSERQHGGGIPPVCHDCSCEQRICKVCPKCGPPKVLEVLEERQPVDPRPVRGGGGGGHQSICDNCSCNEYVCKKSCPQCQHHGGLLQEE